MLPVTVRAPHHDGVTTTLSLCVGQPGAAAAATMDLLARITRRSSDALGLQVGERLYAQVKGAALMR